MSETASFGGGCACGAIRYRLESEPLYVHCCHCRWCQRETGAAFALNALIEADRVTVLSCAPETIPIPSESGRGQKIARCPDCRVALWSHYGGLDTLLSFVRVGTLDEPDLVPPDIHIFTESKQPWVILPSDRPVALAYYETEEMWPQASLARLKELIRRRPD